MSHYDDDEEQPLVTPTTAVPCLIYSKTRSKDRERTRGPMNRWTGDITAFTDNQHTFLKHIRLPARVIIFLSYVRAGNWGPTMAVYVTRVSDNLIEGNEYVHER